MKTGRAPNLVFVDYASVRYDPLRIDNVEIRVTDAPIGPHRTWKSPMRLYHARLASDSVIRLGVKPYLDDEGRRIVSLKFAEVELAISDSVKNVGQDVDVYQDLIIQVRLSAKNLDHAVGSSLQVAEHALGLLSCATLAGADNPRPIWAYDATDGTHGREYVGFFHGFAGLRSTRGIVDEHFIHILEKLYGSFAQNGNVQSDFKVRLYQAITAFRRGLSDNQDVLSEFITAWSTMEGLDCVYRKLLRGPTVKDFKDGMKDVLKRLGAADRFESLNGLRNEIAHGNISIVEATKTASGNLNLVRRAHVLMILRILCADQRIIDEILESNPYKGKTKTCVLVNVTGNFDPVRITDFENQPKIDLSVTKELYKIEPPKYKYTPIFNISTVGMVNASIPRWAVVGDPGATDQVSFSVGDEPHSGDVSHQL